MKQSRASRVYQLQAHQAQAQVQAQVQAQPQTQPQISQAETGQLQISQPISQQSSQPISQVQADRPEADQLPAGPVQAEPKALRSTKTAEKSSYHHGDLRQSLIEAAIELIQAGDISQISLREVARRVGVSHNAPYRHFQDKEALLSAVAEQGFRGLHQATAEALEGLPPDAAQRLSAIGAAYVQFAVQHPVYYRVMFSLDNRQDPALKTAIEQSSGVLLHVIQAGQAAGRFRTGDPTLMAQVAWAFVHGIAMLAIEGQLPAATDPLEQFLQTSSRLLLEGFTVGEGVP